MINMKGMHFLCRLILCREVVNPAESTWNIQDKEDREYYNEIPGKEPPAGGLLDARLKVPTEHRTTCAMHCEQQYCPVSVFMNEMA